jgi:hypothetical protein
MQRIFFAILAAFLRELSGKSFDRKYREGKIAKCDEHADLRRLPDSYIPMPSLKRNPRHII